MTHPVRYCTECVLPEGSAARCPHCARILSKRRLDPATVDHFREQMPASWRVGERLYYINGTRAH